VKLVKRKILAIVTVSVVSLLVAALFFYGQISNLQNQVGELQAQNSELQDQNSDLQDQIGELQNQNSVLQDRLDEQFGGSPVKIMAAELTGWAPLGGLTIMSQVEVTVQNIGSTDLSGLTLTVRLLNKNNVEVGDGYSQQIDGLRAGESREFSGAVYYSIDSKFMIESTVTIGDVVLDEYVR
jgi:predicted PurR-regulated permease PerM